MFPDDPPKFMENPSGDDHEVKSQDKRFPLETRTSENPHITMLYNTMVKYGKNKI